MKTDTVSIERMGNITWLKLGLAALSGLLIYLAFPPADVGAVAWVGLVPLFFALTQVRPLGGLVLGLVFSMCFFLPLSSFMLSYGIHSWLIAGIGQCMFWGLFGLAATAGNGCLHPALRALPMAAAYTLAAEVFRGSIGAFGFTNGDLGYTQHSQLGMLQMASIAGHYGLGFAIAALNAVLAQTALAIAPGLLLRPAVNPKWFAHTAAKTALAAYVLLLLIYFWGMLVMKTDGQETGRPLSVAVVQGCVPTGKPTTEEDVQRSLETYLTLSESVPDDVRLIVWPETAVPDPINRDEAKLQRIRDLAVAKDTWIFAGAPELRDSRELYNTLYLISPDGELTDTYSKVILVPFGEYVPQRDKYKFLERFPVRKFDFTHGEGHKVLDVDGHKIGPLICFEMCFPHALWANTRLGAEIIVAATSDEWAHGTPEIKQHSYTAALRAVESRRYIVRAGTWGISGIITPYGRFLSPVADSTPGTGWEDVYSRTELSTYHRYGDTPLLLICFGIWFAALFSTLMSRSARKREG